MREVLKSKEKNKSVFWSQYHFKLFIGFQEACCIGMDAAIDKDDSIITAYRCHGWTYLNGVSAAEILCELAGQKMFYFYTQTSFYMHDRHPQTKFSSCCRAVEAQ